MTKPFLSVMLACTLLACAQIGVQLDNGSDSDFAAFVPLWERAQTRFINGDPNLWKQNASHGEDVTIFGAFGGSEKGWEKVGLRNDWASAQFVNSGATQEIEYLNIGTSGDLAFTVSIERQLARIAGQETPTPRALRVTQIFRSEGGVWKLLHRHADPLVERLPPSERR
jgi:ketosteroid isomerase-like protein